MIRQDVETSAETKQRQEDDVRHMFNFACNLSECRRVQLLQHFDERFDRAQCRRTCDTCKDDRARLSTDVTQEGLGALRMAEAATSNGINLAPNAFQSAMRGAQTQDLKNKGATGLPGFGCAKDKSTDLVDLLFKEMVYRGYLAVSSVVNGSGYHSDFVEVCGCLRLLRPFEV